MLYNLEGLLDFSNVPYPRKNKDPRLWGWNLGRQFIYQYLVEISLKCAYAKYHNDVFPRTHNLKFLFQKLPNSRRKAVERKYRTLLNGEVKWTFDVFKTVESFLKFLGKNPITETRYYWDCRSVSNTLGVESFQALINPDSYRPLVYALYIVLHGYPSRPIVKHYDTIFRSLTDTLRNQSNSNVVTHESVANIDSNKSNLSTDPNLIYNMEGVLDYFQAMCPHESTDLRILGWNIGRQVIAQYLVEILLKCAYAKHNNDDFRRDHNLEFLFNELPLFERRAVEEKYKELLNSEVQSTWDVFETVGSFLTFLGENPITETRYYWDRRSKSNTLGVNYFQALINPDSYRPLVYALYIVLHGYPSRPIVKRYDTIFSPLRDSLKDEPGST